MKAISFRSQSNASRPPVRWIQLGVALGLLIAPITLLFFGLGNLPSQDILVKALPILPLALVFAGMNAFNEEMQFRSGVARLIQLPLFILLLGALLFGCAGRWDWWGAWAFLAMFVVMMGVAAAWSLRNNPDLINERGRVAENTKPWDKVILALYTLLLLGSMVTAGLDVRFKWSSMPLSMQILGGIGLLAAMVLVGGLFGIWEAVVFVEGQKVFLAPFLILALGATWIWLWKRSNLSFAVFIKTGPVTALMVGLLPSLLVGLLGYMLIVGSFIEPSKIGM